MPGGICAALVDSDFRAAARCGLLNLRVLGVPLEVNLGGFAEAYFPEKTDAELSSLVPGERFSITWERAVFFGKHRFLGDVIVRLRPDRHTLFPPSYVESLSSAGGPSFFPAINKNHLVFTVDVPRFGLHLESVDAIVNSASITRIPPYGSVYEMEKPVKYAEKSGSWLAGLLSTTIEKCAVKLVELSNIKVVLVEQSRSLNEVVFEATLTNETTEPDITVTWMVWPEERGAESLKGSVALGHTAVSVQISVPIEVLKEQRWFGLAISQPFQTEAGQITRFPLET